MTKSRASSGSKVLRPRARLLNLIGEELISDEPVAVVELVKNAFDADATFVKISFKGVDPDCPERIVIEDDGHGMALETVLGAWLEPGTVFKKETSHSPNGRTFQGAKGIGRFAAARLAHELLLESRTEDGAEVTVLLEWDQFDDERYLDEIEVEYEQRRSARDGAGTILSLERIRKPQWTSDEYEALHHRLSRLVSPFNDVKDFRIELDIPGYEELSGEIEPPDMVLSPMYLMKGVLDESGYFSGKLSAYKKTNPHLLKGDIVRSVKGKIGGKDDVPACGGFEVEIRAWDRDRESLEPYFVKTLGHTLTKVRNTLNAFCGVSIYRDGFRVYPYGETGNDWLYLDNRSRQNPTARLANNQIVGAIRISRDGNPELKDRSNREGMVANDAHEELAKWFELIMLRFEEFRYPIRPRQKDTDRPSQIFEDLDISAFLHDLKEKLGDDPEARQLIDEKQVVQRKNIERIQETFSRMLRSAGLGQMVDIVVHEIGTPLGKIGRQRQIISKAVERHTESPTLELLNGEVEKLGPWIDEIRSLRGRLEPQSPAKRGRATAFDVREEVEDTVALYQSLIEKQKIKVELNLGDEEVRVRMTRSSLTQVLANLVDNAIGWIRHKHGAEPSGRLQIRLSPLEHGFEIEISDNGCGVPPENRSLLFEPYFTTKPAGMGLGLHISRLVIEPYGKLVLSDNAPLGGATFIATFEQRVGR